MPVLAAALGETVATGRLVFANPGLRRVNLALAGSQLGDWAFSTAVSVYAYAWGGPAAVGVYLAVRLGVVAVTLPFLAALADRWPRLPFLVTTDLVRAVLVAAAIVLVVVDAPAPVVLVLAGLVGFVGAPFRPAMAGLLPSLARTPTELTGSNAVASTVDGLASFVGPALGGLLLGVGGVPVVLALDAASFLWSAALLSRVRRPAAPVGTAGSPGDEATPAADGAGPEEPAEDADEGVAGVLAGFRFLLRTRLLGLVAVMAVLQCVLAGAAGVFVVTIAFQVLRFGDAGVGYLNAVLGVGSVVGGVVAIGRSSRGSVARDYGTGVLGWAAPLLLVAAWPHPAAAFVALAVVGLANPLVDVNEATLLQRLVPEALLGRVFGAIESAAIGGMALGSLLMPLLARTVGLRWGLVVLAGPVVVVALLARRTFARVDRSSAPPPHLEFLRSLPAFRSMSPAALEQLAGRLVPLHVPAGRAVVTEGEPGDLYHLIVSGTFEARRGAQVLSTMTAGDGFGEIALLRDVPRTATVAALTPSELLTLDRTSFLGAVAQDAEYAGQVEAVATARLRA